MKSYASVKMLPLPLASPCTDCLDSVFQIYKTKQTINTRSFKVDGLRNFSQTLLFISE